VRAAARVGGAGRVTDVPDGGSGVAAPADSSTKVSLT
jgi:hypothetical protein